MLNYWVLTFNIDPMGVLAAIIIVSTAVILAGVFIYADKRNLITERNNAVVCFILGSVLFGLWLFMQYGVNTAKLPVETLQAHEVFKSYSLIGAELSFAYPIIVHFIMKKWLKDEMMEAKE